MNKRTTLLSLLILFLLLMLTLLGCEMSKVDDSPQDSDKGTVVSNKLSPPLYSVEGKTSTVPLELRLSTGEVGEIYYARAEGHLNVAPDPDDAAAWTPYNNSPIELGVVLAEEDKREQLFTVWSFTEKDGRRSDIVKEQYRITGTITIKIEIKPDPNFPGKSRAVVISYPHEAIKKFTLDGRTTPSRIKGDFYTSAFDDLTNAILITEVVDIKAFAYLEGWIDSEVVSKETTLSIEKVGFRPGRLDRIYHFGTSLSAYSKPNTANIFYLEYGYNDNPPADAVPEDRSVAETTAGITMKAHSEFYENLMIPKRVAARGFSSDNSLAPSNCEILEFKVKLPQALIVEDPGANISPDPEGGKIVDDTRLQVTLELDPASPGMPTGTDISSLSAINYYYTLIDVGTNVGESTVFNRYDPLNPIELNSTKELVVFSSYADSPTRTHDMTTGVEGWVDSELTSERYLFKLVTPTIEAPMGTTFNTLAEALRIANIGMADEVYFTINKTGDTSNDVALYPDYIYDKESHIAKRIGAPNSDYQPVILNDDARYFKADSEGKLILKIQSVKNVAGGEDILSPVCEKIFYFHLKEPTGFTPEANYASDIWVRDDFNLNLSAENGTIRYKELAFDSGDLLEDGAALIFRNSDVAYSAFPSGGLTVDKTSYFAFQVTKPNWKSSEEIVKRYIFRPTISAITYKDNPEGSGVDGTAAAPYQDPTVLTFGCATDIDRIYYTFKDTSAITGDYPVISPNPDDIDDIDTYGFLPLNSIGSGFPQNFEQLAIDHSLTLTYFSFKENWQASRLVREDFVFKVKDPLFKIEGVEQEPNVEVEVGPDQEVVIDLDYALPLRNDFTLIYDITYTEDGSMIPPARHFLSGGALTLVIDRPQTIKVKAVRQDALGNDISLSSADVTLTCSILIDKPGVTKSDSALEAAGKIITLPAPAINPVEEYSEIREFDAVLGADVTIDLTRYSYILTDKPAAGELTVKMNSSSTDPVVVKYKNSAAADPGLVEFYFNNTPPDIDVLEAGTTFTAWIEEFANPSIRSSKIRAIFDFKVAAPTFSDPTLGIDDPASGIVDPAAKIISGDSLELLCPTNETRVVYTVSYTDDSGAAQTLPGVVERDLNGRYLITGLPEISPLTITMHGERTDLVDGREYNWLNSNEVSAVFYRELPLPALEKYTLDSSGREIITSDDIDIEKLVFTSTVPGVNIHYTLSGETDNSATVPVDGAAGNSLTVTVPNESPIEFNYYAAKAGWLNSAQLRPAPATPVRLERRLKVTTFETTPMNEADTYTSVTIEANAPGTEIKFEVTIAGATPVTEERTYSTTFPVTVSQTIRITSLTKTGWLPPDPAAFPEPLEIKKCATPTITVTIDRDNPANDTLSFGGTETDAVISYVIAAVDAAGGAKRVEETAIYDGINDITIPFLKSDYDSQINIYAYATKSGFLKSDTATEENYKRVLLAPELQQAGFDNDNKTITIRFAAHTDDADIYWSKDASPDLNNPMQKYDGSDIIIDSVCTIYATAVKNNWTPAEMTPVVIGKCATPIISRADGGSGTIFPAGGNTKISIASATTGTGLKLVYQKIDPAGTWPVVWSPYTSQINIERNSRVRARLETEATASYMIPSEITLEREYEVQLAAPSSISPVPSPDGVIRKVRFDHVDSNVTIAYKMIGPSGNIESTVTPGITIDIPESYYRAVSPLRFEAIAIKTGYKNSAPLTEVQNQTVEKPVVTISHATDSESAIATIECGTAGAAIYFTTNGSNPTASSTPYPPTGIPISSAVTIKAIAVKANWDNSEVSESKSIGKCDTPLFSQSNNYAFPSGGGTLIITNKESGTNTTMVINGTVYSSLAYNATMSVPITAQTTVTVKVYRAGELATTVVRNYSVRYPVTSGIYQDNFAACSTHANSCRHLHFTDNTLSIVYQFSTDGGNNWSVVATDGACFHTGANSVPPGAKIRYRVRKSGYVDSIYQYSP